MSEDLRQQSEYTFGTRTAFRTQDDCDRFVELLVGENPVQIEVGSGKGLFLVNAAKQFPGVQFIGLEIASKYAAMCNKKLERAELKNATCFCADGVIALDQHVADERVDAVHVYFPDPWWKAKHKKRRVLNSRMIAAIDRVLKPNGKLHFWTDVLDYFESTVELIASETKWDGPHLIEERTAEDDLDYLTHFERRTRLNSLPVFRSYYVKRPA